MNKEPIISAQNLSIGYPKSRNRNTSVLYEDMSFNLYAGELTCLLGSNGAGKSTLLRTLTGLQPSLRGEVNLREKNISKYSEQQLSTLLGLVLTDKTIVGGLTVSELVALGRYPYTGFFGRLTKEDHQIVEKAMNDVCILHKKDSYVAELSDGERQKVMIAKALAQECPIIILDEPTAFLDIVNRIEIMNLLHLIAIKQNKTILLSTHDIELALTLADRLWLLARDKGLKCGVTEDIVLSDAINDYIGNSTIVFDRQTGRFVSEHNITKEIYLEADGELFFWTKNFLSRKGYSLTDNATNELSLKLSSSTGMSVIRNNRTEILSSFEELDLWLKG
ncbi:iron complex transport system ATP-binding protein [Dysgonomonas alginatilytica]|uniref:Iron complex transport system ATP-binding protein n=1 Tax=Dysgonomonas alginatilytica TaxID=1605892 RepID=A0A2V3PR27_9BACT|nr:ABC transporter ATP-binding protein [Dysgonomonas alginatilytica]PXV64076.1 iron complex transport system ATP-binding protein [Dysgonomonas alginatilytica]